MSTAAVIFDFGGVIIPGSPSVDDPDSLWSRLEREHGLPRGSLWRAIYLDNPAWLGLRVGEGSFEGWREACLAQVTALADAERAAKVVDAFWASRERAGSGRDGARPEFNPGMIEVIESLRGRVRVGLLSNAAPGLEDELREYYGIAHLFDDIVNSATVRLAKPDVRVFRLAAERLGVAPGECFFTDDLPHNVEAARTTGMTAHHFLGSEGLVEALRAAGVAV